MKTPGKKNDGMYVVWFIIGVFAIFFSIYLYNAISRTKFRPFLESYLLQYGQMGDENADFTTLPSPVHAIVVSPNDSSFNQQQEPISYSIDLLNNRLPAAIRAKKPAEVNVIVLVIESDVSVGRYDDGQPAYRKKLEVLIIDARSNAIFSRSEFLGGNPPTSKSTSGPGYGSMPNASAVGWIKRVLGFR
jgi:hypothetical protein